jgi:hypothetical protein
MFSHGRLQTASSFIRDWSEAYPVLPFFIGFVLGHLFFNTR